MLVPVDKIVDTTAALPHADGDLCEMVFASVELGSEVDAGEERGW